MAGKNSNSALSQFELAILDCRQLYLSGARECAERHPELIKGPPEKFVQRMDDLHKGLLAKIYVAVADADGRWSKPEQQMAEVLFEHLWGARLTGAPLREAMQHGARKAAGLKWYALLRPFEEIAPLRARVGELETVVMRVANLVAKANGEAGLSERACLTEISVQLMDIQNELQRQDASAVSDAPGGHEAAHSAGVQAVQSLDSHADEVRTRCDLSESEEKTEAPGSLQEPLEAALAELDGLVGIGGIKQEVRTLVNFLEIQRRREQAGLPRTPLSLHMVFRGNPGTGKTTVARIVGRILGAMGILEKGHVVETDRSGLVAEYAGQTASKTNKKIDEALDGILFIDEAYSLVAETGDDPFGTEAVQILLKRMEDDRERLVVALAGYPEPIENLLKTNPGLSSRFSRNITFHNYSAAELGEIFQILCDKNRYVTPPDVRAKLLLGFQWLLDDSDEHFGNGRMVRNVFETAIRRLANRIIDVVPVTEEVLTTFDADDVHMPKVPGEVWKDLQNKNRKFTIACPGCRARSKLPQRYLGRRMQCKKCKHRFAAGWGEPVRDARHLAERAS